MTALMLLLCLVGPAATPASDVSPVETVSLHDLHDHDDHAVLSAPPVCQPLVVPITMRCAMSPVCRRLLASTIFHPPEMC